MSDGPTVPAVITGTPSGRQMVAALNAAKTWNVCDPPTNIPPDAVRAIVEAVVGAIDLAAAVKEALTPDELGHLEGAIGAGVVEQGPISDQPEVAQACSKLGLNPRDWHGNDMLDKDVVD